MSWRVNDESGGGAFFGGCNFLVAGAVPDMTSSHVWTDDEAKKVYETADGDVTITKPDPDGAKVHPTWETKCLNATGRRVGTGVGSTSGNQVNLTEGAGEIDPSAKTGEVSWDGDFTIVYYGGMTYWTISDPVLTVKDGKGTLTGTASGYGADMHDPSKWVTLPETEIELATFSGAEVTEQGMTIEPDYAGVEVEGDGSGTFNPQDRSKDGWGSFPQSWVDFNLLTGQSAYWYTSGGAADPKKVAAEFAVAFDAQPAEDPEPAPEGTEEGDIDLGVEVPEGEGSTDPSDPTDPTDPSDPTDPNEPTDRPGGSRVRGEHLQHLREPRHR